MKLIGSGYFEERLINLVKEIDPNFDLNLLYKNDFNLLYLNDDKLIVKNSFVKY